MRIAVAYENGTVFQHFGHAEHFMVCDVEDEKIIRSEIVDTKGSGHSTVAKELSDIKADVLLCGGIGNCAQTALTATGIKFYGGVSGNAEDAVNSFIAGNLKFDEKARCYHHDHNCTVRSCKGHCCGSAQCNNHKCDNVTE